MVFPSYHDVTWIMETVRELHGALRTTRERSSVLRTTSNASTSNKSAATVQFWGQLESSPCVCTKPATITETVEHQQYAARVEHRLVGADTLARCRGTTTTRRCCVSATVLFKDVKQYIVFSLSYRLSFVFAHSINRESLFGRIPLDHLPPKLESVHTVAPPLHHLDNHQRRVDFLFPF